MKRFHYRYEDLQRGVLTNSDRTNLKRGDLYYGGSEYGLNYWSSFLDGCIEDAVVPEISYTDTTAAVQEKTVKAWTFYCDSISYSQDNNRQKGNGSKKNPWNDLHYALIRIALLQRCWQSHFCCDNDRAGKYFQLKIKGTVDYSVYPNYGAMGNIGDYSDTINGKKICQLIITPYGDLNLSLGESSWRNLSYIIFHNFNYNFNYSSSSYPKELYHCIFNHIHLSYEEYVDSFITGIFASEIIDLRISHPYAHISNMNTPWPSIASQHIGGGSNTYINFQIKNCVCNFGAGAHFYGGEINISRGFVNSSSYGYNLWFSGVISSYDSVFNNIDLSIDLSDIIWVDQDAECYHWDLCGFHGCSNSVFSGCNVSIVIPELQCHYSEFYEEYYGYVDVTGWYDCGNSSFYNCNTTNSCQKCADETHECRTPDF